MADINTKQGGVPIQINGVERRLGLTLGALAMIEEGLKIESLEQLQSRFDKPSVRDLIVIMTALLIGGGHTGTKEEIVGELNVWDVSPERLLEMIMAAFNASSMVKQADEGKNEPEQ